MIHQTDTESPQPVAEAENLVGVAMHDLLAVLRCLRLLQECPPTVRQIIETGDRAIDAAGLNPWCLNEGLAEGNERHTPWRLEDCIQTIAAAISAANVQGHVRRADLQPDQTPSSASHEPPCSASSILWRVLDGVEIDLAGCIDWLDTDVPEGLKTADDREDLTTACRLIDKVRCSLEDSLRKNQGLSGTKQLRAETRRYETTQGYAQLAPGSNPYQARKQMRELVQLRKSDAQEAASTTNACPPNERRSYEK